MKNPAAIALLVLAGCRAEYKEPALPSDHPANAAAPPSPPIERSRTLAVEPAESENRSPPGMDEDGEHRGHSGHGGGR